MLVNTLEPKEARHGRGHAAAPTFCICGKRSFGAPLTSGMLGATTLSTSAARRSRRLREDMPCGTSQQATALCMRLSAGGNRDRWAVHWFKCTRVLH